MYSSLEEGEPVAVDDLHRAAAAVQLGCVDGADAAGDQLPGRGDVDAVAGAEVVGPGDDADREEARPAFADRVRGPFVDLEPGDRALAVAQPEPVGGLVA